jgi:23S rRNA pseudouridine2457 synthase
MLIAFFKPYDVLSQFTAAVPGQRTLAQFGFPPDVYGIGRLDRDSEGLLLLSEESRWTEGLLGSAQRHTRTYWVQVEGAVTEAQMEQLRAGVQLKQYRCRPCLVKLLDSKRCESVLPPRIPPVRYRALIPTSWLEITMTEGKNRQVRHMTAAVGCPTLRLVRVRVGELDVLGLGLQPGEWRTLATKEIKALLKTGETGSE